MPTKNNTFLSTNENSGCGWCGTFCLDELHDLLVKMFLKNYSFKTIQSYAGR